MKLMTKEIERKMPKFESTSGVPIQEKQVITYYFTPWSNWRWYVVEGERQENGDLMFFGLVHGFEKEWGYFSLSELESVQGPFGMKIERELYSEGMKIKDIRD